MPMIRAADLNRAEMLRDIARWRGDLAALPPMAAAGRALVLAWIKCTYEALAEN